MFSTVKEKEQAILVGVESTGTRSKWSARDSLSELQDLALSAGANVVGKFTQKLTEPSRMLYLGKGKVAELLALKSKLNFNIVIVDDELTPQQQENLEDMLQTKVIDRVTLILDIFARRARTHEGKIQVELAQHEYNLPRLAGKWRHLERLGAGIGTRGPGESQLETDRRLIKQKITHLKKKLEEIRQHRSLYRQKRKRTGVPVVALVGYTNAGKSSLLNSLSNAGVLAKNEPFSTLDPTTRKLVLPDGRRILFTDTVGFIRKLPATLIAAFRATLEELSEADLLIHVIDINSINATEQSETVEEILQDLKLQDKPRINALNKVDLLLPDNRKWNEQEALTYIIDRCGMPDEDSILISAEKKWGLNRLLEKVEAKLVEK